MSTATVPSAKGFFNEMGTSPSVPRVTRSCATEGLKMYSRTASRPASSIAPVARGRVQREAVQRDAQWAPRLHCLMSHR